MYTWAFECLPAQGVKGDSGQEVLACDLAKVDDGLCRSMHAQHGVVGLRRERTK